VPNFRSPTFLLILGGTALALSVAAFFIDGKSPALWAFLFVAVPPIIEGQASEQSARFGSMIYGKDADDIERLAYRPWGALLRCIYLFCYLSIVFLMGRGGFNLLPDNGLTVAIILGPFILYLIWAGVAYRKSIAAIANRERWSKVRKRPR
jgi:hypothetical protein